MINFFKRKEDRNVLFHIHFFKNAGSTIDSMLMNHFQGDMGNLEGQYPYSVVPTSLFTSYLSKNPNLKAITSHQALFPLKHSGGFSFFPIFFLRHPIDRIGSIYSFEQRQDSNAIGPVKAKTLNMNDYILWRLSDGGGIAMNNFHVLRLSNALTNTDDPRNIRATNQNFNEATKRLEQCEFFGIVEHFDDSLSLMKNYLEPYFPSLEYTYEKKNISSVRASSLDERIKIIKQQIEPETYKKLLENNSLDIQLYNHALHLFGKRMVIIRNQSRWSF